MSCHDLELQGFETALTDGGAITKASTGRAARMAARTRRRMTATDILALALLLVSLLTETAVRALVWCRFALGHLKGVIVA